MSKTAAYPVDAGAEDSRFTLGLVVDVADVLARHGYPPVRDSADLVDLQQSLYRFLYVADRTRASRPEPAKLAGAGPGWRAPDPLGTDDERTER